MKILFGSGLDLISFIEWTIKKNVRVKIIPLDFTGFNDGKQFIVRIEDFDIPLNWQFFNAKPVDYLDYLN